MTAIREASGTTDEPHEIEGIIKDTLSGVLDEPQSLTWLDMVIRARDKANEFIKLATAKLPTA